MSSFNDQVWLTSVLVDTDVRNALTLCISLRRTVTCRKIGIIVSPQVSRELQDTFESCFDFVFPLQLDRNVTGLKQSEFLKLYGLTLKNFKICVILAPNMLALKNCDELFDWAEQNVDEYAWTKDAEMSVFVIRPSLHVSNRVLQESGRNVGTGLSLRMEKYVEDKYNRKLLDKSEMLLEDRKDVLMVNLPSKFGDELEKQSLEPLTQLAVRLWKNINSKNVQPWLATLSKLKAEVQTEQPTADENVTISIVEIPVTNSLKTLARPAYIMKISAMTDKELEMVLDEYKAYLTKSRSDFHDFAYTANTGRADFCQRAILIAKSNKDAIRSIQQNKLIRGNEKPGKICFLFTGQGSQYPEMARQLYETSPVYRKHFDYCKKSFKNNYNIDIGQVLWSNDKAVELSRTIYSHPSIFCVEYALLKLWESLGVKPDYALGHSLGESAAAVCAGIMTIDDTIKVVAERARLIDQLPHGKMLVIKADQQKADALMNEFANGNQNKMLDLAAINSPEQTVFAGDSDVVQKFGKFCTLSNIKCIVLDATHAIHSKHMDPILNELRAVAKTVTHLGGNDCQYISGMNGKLVEACQLDAEYWVSHTREKVLFLNASKKAVDLGCRTFIEIGPQPVLSAQTMMKNNKQLTCLPSMKRNGKEWETLLNTLGKLYVVGTKIDWKGFEK